MKHCGDCFTVENDIEDHFTEDNMDKEIITVENDMKDHFTEGHNKKEISFDNDIKDQYANDVKQKRKRMKEKKKYLNRRNLMSCSLQKSLISGPR